MCSVAVDMRIEMQKLYLLFIVAVTKLWITISITYHSSESFLSLLYPYSLLRRLYLLAQTL